MTIRTLTNDDAPALAALFEASGWNFDAEGLRAGRYGALKPSETKIRWFALIDGQPVGYARIERDPDDPEGQFGVELLTRPDARKRGVGAALWTTLADEARFRGATKLKAQVRDDAPDALAFAERRGFEKTGHLFESFLDLATFTPPDHPTPEGLRVFSMADVPDDEAHRRKLWRLNDWDLEAGAGACRSFERFTRDVFEGYWYRPEGQIVAAIDDDWVGLSAVGLTAEGKGYNMMTGVVPAHRRRGIATALKLATIAWARRQGLREIWTHNGADNAPMLSINRKLGYRPVPGWFHLKGAL